VVQAAAGEALPQVRQRLALHAQLWGQDVIAHLCPRGRDRSEGMQSWKAALLTSAPDHARNLTQWRAVAEGRSVRPVAMPLSSTESIAGETGQQYTRIQQHAAALQHFETSCKLLLQSYMRLGRNDEHLSRAANDIDSQTQTRQAPCCVPQVAHISVPPASRAQPRSPAGAARPAGGS